MRAELHPLEGKYYQSRMTITLEDGRTVNIELTSSDERVSQRELEADPDFFNAGGPWDGHYEREATYEAAALITHLVNRHDRKGPK